MQRCPGVGFPCDLVSARGQAQREAHPVVLPLDVQVSVDHGEAIDSHGQSDLVVVEGLVADIEDEVRLGLADEPYRGVGGDDLWVRSWATPCASPQPTRAQGASARSEAKVTPIRGNRATQRVVI